MLIGTSQYGWKTTSRMLPLKTGVARPPAACPTTTFIRSRGHPGEPSRSKAYSLKAGTLTTMNRSAVVSGSWRHRSSASSSCVTRRESGTRSWPIVAGPITPSGSSP